MSAARTYAYADTLQATVTRISLFCVYFCFRKDLG